MTRDTKFPSTDWRARFNPENLANTMDSRGQT
jgi:hypothetical protein